MNLIADTNIWYDLGPGRRNPQTLKAGGNRLIATPTSMLEIASLIDDHNLHDRKMAAQAVIDYADEVTHDSESHLAMVWGLQGSPQAVPWLEGFNAVAQANSAAHLRTGVEDFQQMVRRKVNLPALRIWRDYHWDDFKDKVIDAIEDYVPGYRAARSRGTFKHLNKQRGRRFADALRSNVARGVLVRATFARALLASNQVPREPSQSEYDRAEPLVSPYIDTYTEYLIGCATEFAPQSNDLGDSECFIYLQDGNAFLSGDKRWVRLARKACPSRCLDPENKVP